MQTKEQRITTIFFDIGNVLVAWDWTHCHAELARLSGKSVSELEEVFWGAGEGDPAGVEHLYGTGLVTTDEFVELVRKRVASCLAREHFERLWNGIFTPIRPMLELVERLKRAGLRLIIISNTNELHFTYEYGAFPALSRFDDFVLSYEIGACKPDDRIWRAALAKAATPSEACLFVDDYPVNVEAFYTRFGVKGFVYEQENHAALEAFLRDHGVVRDQ